MTGKLGIIRLTREAIEDEMFPRAAMQLRLTPVHVTKDDHSGDLLVKCLSPQFGEVLWGDKIPIFEIEKDLKPRFTLKRVD
jgi:hypothetical protein